MNVTASGVRKASASRRSTRNESERLRSAAKLSFARPARRIGGSMDTKGDPRSPHLLGGKVGVPEGLERDNGAGPHNNPSHVPAACFDLGQLPPTPIFDPSTLKRRPKPLGFREYVHARVIPIATAHSVACVAGEPAGAP